MQRTREGARADDGHVLGRSAQDITAQMMDRCADGLAALKGAGVCRAQAFKDVSQPVACQVETAPRIGLLGHAHRAFVAGGKLCCEALVGVDGRPPTNVSVQPVFRLPGHAVRRQRQGRHSSLLLSSRDHAPRQRALTARAALSLSDHARRRFPFGSTKWALTTSTW